MCFCRGDRPIRGGSYQCYLNLVDSIYFLRRLMATILCVKAARACLYIDPLIWSDWRLFDSVQSEMYTVCDHCRGRSVSQTLCWQALRHCTRHNANMSSAITFEHRCLTAPPYLISHAAQLCLPKSPDKHWAKCTKAHLAHLGACLPRQRDQRLQWDLIGRAECKTIFYTIRLFGIVIIKLIRSVVLAAVFLVPGNDIYIPK